MEAFRDKLGSSDEVNTVAKKEGRHLSKCVGYKPTPEVTPRVISFLKCRPYDKLRRNTWQYVKKSVDHTPLTVHGARYYFTRNYKTLCTSSTTAVIKCKAIKQTYTSQNKIQTY